MVASSTAWYAIAYPRLFSKNLFITMTQFLWRKGGDFPVYLIAAAYEGFQIHLSHRLFFLNLKPSVRTKQSTSLISLILS